jgi:hypothetical protein
MADIIIIFKVNSLYTRLCILIRLSKKKKKINLHHQTLNFNQFNLFVNFSR